MNRKKNHMRLWSEWVSEWVRVREKDKEDSINSFNCGLRLFPIHLSINRKTIIVNYRCLLFSDEIQNLTHFLFPQFCYVFIPHFIYIYIYIVYITHTQSFHPFFILFWANISIKMLYCGVQSNSESNKNEKWWKVWFLFPPNR